MCNNSHAFTAKIESSEIGKGGAYVRVPLDIREVFGKGRVYVHATFDGVPYDGSVVNMGVKNADGSICYILGIRKDIQTQIGKTIGDTAEVTVAERTAKKWKCPKCGREFINREQDHYCVKPGSIDEYIMAQPGDVQPLLQKIYKTIRSLLPEATERISWQMPTFWQGENIIHFAAFKKHIGIYPGGEATTAFAERLSGYKTSKGAIQFPLNKPVDYELIADIVRWRIETLK